MVVVVGGGGRDVPEVGSIRFRMGAQCFTRTGMRGVNGSRVLCSNQGRCQRLVIGRIFTINIELWM